MNATESKLIDFIRVQLLEDPEYDLTPDDELLLDDIVDSLGVMRLVEFIEHEGGAAVPAEDVTIDNFSTVSVIAGYLSARSIAIT